MLTQLVPYVGLAAFTLVVPITLAILGVLFFVTLSYLEVIQLYTKAGGSYVVARDNFGPKDRPDRRRGAAHRLHGHGRRADVGRHGRADQRGAQPGQHVRHRRHHGRRRPPPPLRQPARHPRGRAATSPSRPTSSSSRWRRSSSSASSRRRSGTLHHIPLPPADQLYGGHDRHARLGLADGAGLHLAAALLRQRRVVAHRARGHLQRGEQLPQARGHATPARPSSP